LVIRLHLDAGGGAAEFVDFKPPVEKWSCSLRNWLWGKGRRRLSATS